MVNEERCEGVSGRQCDYTAASAWAHLDTCAASSLNACEAVALDGDEATCTQVGKCTYTAEVIERCVPTDAEACANAALDGTGAALPRCRGCVHRARRQQSRQFGILHCCGNCNCTFRGLCGHSLDIPGGAGTFSSADIGANGAFTRGSCCHRDGGREVVIGASPVAILSTQLSTTWWFYLSAG